MHNLLNIWKNPMLKKSYSTTQVTYSKKIHWKKLKKINSHKERALEKFDEFYGTVFGSKWQPMRTALLRQRKYVALVNNFGDTEATVQQLQNMGAHCLKTLMSVQEKFNHDHFPYKDIAGESTKSQGQENSLDDFVSKLQSEEIASVYSQAQEMPERLEINDTVILAHENSKEVEKKKVVSSSVTLEDALSDAVIDETRIVNPSMGLSAESLYQYIPATKIKGMEGWVPESSHYAFYTQQKGGDFPVIVEPENEFVFPEHLKVMTYEMASDAYMFPEPKRGLLGLFNYYPMDMGSVAVVLALGLRAGDRVLDLCAAPGGKSLVALQTMLPDVLFCNDSSVSRMNRLKWILKDYLMDYETDSTWSERLVTSMIDGREFTDDNGFDKVMVDVPCTTDRESVTVAENNIFRPDRVKERLSIPEKQTQLLLQGLRLTRVGGTLVYSTCSLSPAQNDGVVHAALKLAFQEGIVVAVKDLTIPFRALSSTLCLGAGRVKPKYGQLVTPNVGANFGPSYFARLVRLQ